MNQRVPSWNLEEKFSAKSRVINSFHASSSSKTLLSQDNESSAWLGYDRVAELRWENGQPLMQGLGHEHRASGTLQSIVDQATVRGKPDPVEVDQVAPWLGHLFESYAAPSSPTMTMTRGDLVPNCNVNYNHSINSDYNKNNINSNNNNNNNRNDDNGILNQMASSSRMEIVGNCTTRESVTSMGNTGFCYTMSQRETGDEDCRKKRGIEMSSSVPTKKSKAAAAHSQSERKRRDKINQKIRTLQKMIPNSTKTDKASILDEVIEHVGQLQGQVHAMGSKLMSNNVLLQLAIDQQLQLQQNLMGVIGSTTTRPAMDGTASQHHLLQMPSDDLLSAVSARLQSQQQQRTIDLYSVLSSSYQQPHHQAGSWPR